MNLRQQPDQAVGAVRLFEKWGGAMLAGPATLAISCRKDKRNATGSQSIRDGINPDACKVDVEHADIEGQIFNQCECFISGARASSYYASEIDQHILEIKAEKNLVLDDENTKPIKRHFTPPRKTVAYCKRRALILVPTL